MSNGGTVSHKLWFVIDADYDLLQSANHYFNHEKKS
jgi:hypothetical protein